MDESDVAGPVGVPGLPGLVDVVVLGSGGSGVLYRGRQPDLDREVVVKVVPLSDEGARRRFERECRSMGRLSQHPGILTVYASGVAEDGSGFLVLPFVSRGSLQDRLDRDGPLPWEEATALVAEVARAVAAAHEVGILHRDLKPANVLVGEDGRPLLTDFGIARLADQVQTIEASYTPAFAAPEAVHGEQSSPATDVYGLGCLLFTLIAGQPPYADQAEGLLDLSERLPTRLIPSLPGDVPDCIHRLVTLALAKDPTARPSARAFTDDLNSSAESSAPPRGASTRQSVRRSKAMTIAGLLLVVIAAPGATQRDDATRIRVTDVPEVAGEPTRGPVLEALRVPDDPDLARTPQSDVTPTTLPTFDALTIPLGGQPLTPHPREDVIWVIRDDGEDLGSVIRIDATTGAPLDSVRVGSHPRGLAFTDNRAWVHNVGDGTLTAIATDTMVVATTLSVHSGFVPAPAGSEYPDDDAPSTDVNDTVWLTDRAGGRIFTVSHDDELFEVPVGSALPTRPIRVGDEMWVPTLSWCYGGVVALDTTLDLPIPGECATVDRFQASSARHLGSRVLPRNVPWGLDRIDPGEDVPVETCFVDDPDDCFVVAQPAAELYAFHRGDRVRDNTIDYARRSHRAGLFSHGSVWLPQGSYPPGRTSTQQLLRIDLDSHETASYACTLARGVETAFAAVTDDTVWLSTPRAGLVCAVGLGTAPSDVWEECHDAAPERCGAVPEYLPTIAPLSLGRVTSPVPADDGDRVWVGRPDAGSVVLLDVDDSVGISVVAEVEVGPGVGTPAVADDGSIWVPSLGRLTRLTASGQSDGS